MCVTLQGPAIGSASKSSSARCSGVGVSHCRLQQGQVEGLAVGVGAEESLEVMGWMCGLGVDVLQSLCEAEKPVLAPGEGGIAMENQAKAVCEFMRVCMCVCTEQAPRRKGWECSAV